MAQKLPTEDNSWVGQFSVTSERLRLVVFGLFFGGLFILAVGVGLFLFRTGDRDEIEIISPSTEGEDLPAGRQVVVHVAGAVVVPGIYQLPQDARVNDAIIAAGGLASEADQSRINLAAKLADGQKVYIVRVGESTTGVAGEATSLININNASESQLDTLPGVGPVTTQKIVGGRPYGSVEELRTKKIVGQATFEKIKDLITY